MVVVERWPLFKSRELTHSFFKGYNIVILKKKVTNTYEYAQECIKQINDVHSINLYTKQNEVSKMKCNLNRIQVIFSLHVNNKL